ncbi:MAG: DUF3575 domain-containing protein [Bacteroidia bacterium]|nr:DUF3575 domain-containing protein [Bacteroidota bacterium]MBK8364949.1 DUF3575 domain-containing protein [Bacteroidota bacterium]MBP6428070.1 DUF3575 domain-containing protein [Bacteroidia bacterium]MBP6657925.1 DUF3575 domain-containing protein [Bacteroidia bacterium]
MKKILLSIFMLSAFAAGAQTNIVKWNAFGMFLGNISLQYERTLNEHSSVALGLSYLPSRGFPSAAITSDDQTQEADLKKLSFSGFAITPEYRYYFTGKAPKGFYVAPYFRYSKYSFDDVYITYTNSNTNVDEKVVAGGDFKTSVVGVMFGAQWELGEHFALDWWIIGAGFGGQKGTFSAVGNFDSNDIEDIKGELASTDADFPGSFKSTVTSTKVEIEYKSGFPAVRGFGLCLGYKF